MATLVQALTASGGTESVGESPPMSPNTRAPVARLCPRVSCAHPPGFLNDIVAQLWPNIGIAGAAMTKQIAEPMFAAMLPAPLNTLHFSKIDLGKVPIKLGNVDVHKTENGAIKMDLDVDWDGQCDIELDGGAMVPKIGIAQVKLNGRLSVLLGPLLNQIPLVRLWLPPC